MKKLIVSLILGFGLMVGLAFAAKADTVTKVADKVEQSIPDSAKVTFSKVYTDVKAGLQGLGSALKVGAEHVYGVLVKQQIVYSITYLLLYAVILLVFKFTYKLTRTTRFKEQMEESYPDGDYHLIIIANVAVLVILVTLVCCTVENVVTGFVNPEYGAIKEIIKFIN